MVGLAVRDGRLPLRGGCWCRCGFPALGDGDAVGAVGAVDDGGGYET